MRYLKQFAGFVILGAISMVAFQPQAYAYLDPGSGGFFIQMLLAALVGLSFTLKTYWKKIKDFFTKGKGPRAGS